MMDIFELLYDKFKLKNKVRLIELFAGVGSQAMALRNIGVDFEHYRVVEFDKYAIASYNAIHDTNFDVMDITKTKGVELGIVDTDKYNYIMTYSFPCQDLSLAGNRKGMSKGDNTRSGLLWEVERLLNETEQLPQILLMENVPQVISEDNLPDFHKWQLYLESKGYKNYTDTLNAKDYGVAQNRNRTFMISLLGDYSYTFPMPIELTKTMKDYLEEEVDEKYYINNEKAENLIMQLIDKGDLKEETTVVDGSINEPKEKDISNCIKARYDAGISNQKSDGTMVVEPILIGGMQKNQSIKRDGISTTLVSAMGTGGGYVPMIVASRGRNPNNPSDRTTGSPTEQKLEPNSQGLCNTLTSVQKDNLVLERTNELQFVGGIGDKDWAGDNKQFSRNYPQGNRVYSSEGIACSQTANGGGLGGATGLYLDAILVYDPYNLSLPKDQEAITTLRTNYSNGNAQIIIGYRIRKLTPLECWRLMGFTDTDFYKAEKVNSNSQLYKQAGNSIVVDVLEAIFRQLL